MDCRDKCSGNCINNEPCNHVSGVCPSGCQDGFVGTLCNKCKTCLTVILIVGTKHISSNEKSKNNTYLLFDYNNFSPPAQKGSGSFSVRLSVCPPVCLSVYKLIIFFLQPLDQIQQNKVHVNAILMGKGF